MPRPVDHGSTYVPGLDGLRALAVIAVLGYHFAIPQMAGGLLGVSIFFTLSGFLITSLLVSTWERTGGLELRRFWLHRARRLLRESFRRLPPAAGSGLDLVLVAQRELASSGQAEVERELRERLRRVRPPAGPRGAAAAPGR